MFANTHFWIAQRVPQRAHYKTLVQQHHGIVIPLERDADILIFDHVRARDAPPGALSYRLIDECIQQGRLLHGDERAVHLCGPAHGSIRGVGDVSRAPKLQKRLAYTREDDEVIRDWVMDAVRRGDRLGGNEVWKDLERHNSRHPWQSWRDRWVKKLAHQMAPGWELEARGLEFDVDELVDQVLEEEARRRETLQHEREREKDRDGEREGERQTLFVPLAPEVANVTMTLPQQLGTLQTPLLSTTGKSEFITPALEPPVTPIPIAPELPYTRTGRFQSQSSPQLSNSQHAQAEYQREPSVGYAPSFAKRARLSAASEEDDIDIRPVLSPTKQASSPHGETQSSRLPRQFTAEEFLSIYDAIDDIMSVSEEHFLSGMAEFAATTDFSAQQWQDFLLNDVLPIHRKFKDVRRKHGAIVACLTDHIAKYPHKSWKRWRMHFEAGGCDIFNDNLSPDNLEESQSSSFGVPQSEDGRPQTPSRKRKRDEVKDSPHLKSPRVAETANISRQRVDINSQSTITQSSTTSQPEVSRAASAKPGRVTEPMNVTRSSDSNDDGDAQLQVPDMFPPTQAILAAETQPLDFSIPEADDGLDDSIAESIESDDFERERRASLRDQELINQQLLGDNTDDTVVHGRLDFDLPVPDDGFEATNAPSEGLETQLLKDTQSLGQEHIGEVDRAENEETASQASLDFDSLADELMEEGHSPENIITAVHTTSANMRMLIIVLQSLKMGKGVPVDMQGVWTAQDDEDILSGDARSLERVEAKHGWRGNSGCKARQYFLRDSMAAAEMAEKQS